MGSNGEIIRDGLAEFKKVQTWMTMTKETSPDAYASMLLEYRSLKALLISLGVNLDEVDFIKE